MKPIILGSGGGTASEDLLERILREATDLLPRVTVSSRDATRLEGDHVVVMAMPDWLGDGFDQYELEVSFCAFSQANVSWPNISVVADALRAVSRVGPVRLTKSGSCILGPLDPNMDYRLLAVPPTSDELLQKFLAALSRTRFTAAEGTATSVEEVEVVVSVRHTGTESICEIQAACRGTGVQIAWESVGVMIESSTGITFAPRWFDKTGRVEFRLEAPVNEVFCLLTSISSSVVLVGSAGQLIADAAERGQQTPNAKDVFAYRVTSLDQRVTAAAWRDPGGVITVQVETRERALRNAIVSLEFQGTDGKVLVEDTFQLDLDKRDKDGNLIYWGEWMRAVSLALDSTMRVTTFPRPAGSGERRIG